MEIELPIHETTGLQALGFRKNGAPIWPILGGSGEGGDGGSGDDGGAGDGGNGDPAGGSDDDEDDDASKITDEESKKILRKWEGRAKTNKSNLDAANQQLADLKTQSQAQLDKIAIALGLKQEQATPEELQKALNESSSKITDAEAKAKKAEIKLGVFTAAAKVDGANAADLLDRISFMEKADKLDPTSDKFEAAMEKLVKENTKTGSTGGGFSAPVGGGAPQGGSGSNETDPRKLAERISRSGGGIRSL